MENRPGDSSSVLHSTTPLSLSEDIGSHECDKIHHDHERIEELKRDQENIASQVRTPTFEDILTFSIAFSPI
jgi:hypothetical protein